MRMRTSNPRRTGFTLVELMVAVTLVIFIMVTLTEAFKAGIDAFRNLKAAGDAAEKLRSAAVVIRRDLASPHFESVGPDPTLREFLRDQRMDQPNWQPPARGFFRIWQGNEPPTPISTATGVLISDGQDSDSLFFTRATRHILHFTAKYEGDDPGEYHTGLALRNILSPPVPAPPAPQPMKPWLNDLTDPATQDLAAFIDGRQVSLNPNQPNQPPQFRYAARWAEVALFLVPNGTTATDSSGNTGPTLHSLHRRVRVIPRTPTEPLPRFRVDVTGTPSASTIEQFCDVSFSPQQQFNNIDSTAPSKFRFFNNLQMVTDPRLRMDSDSTSGGATNTALVYGPLNNLDGTTNVRRPRNLSEVRGSSSDTVGDDILLNDVISFEVKVWWAPHAGLGLPISNSLGYNDLNNNGINVADTDAPFRALPDPATFGNAYQNTLLPKALSNGQVRLFDTWIADTLLQSELTANGIPQMDWSNPIDTPGQGAGAPPQKIGYFSTYAPYKALNLQVPLRIHVKALQIKLRIWDVKTKTTRQVTIVQEV